MKKITKSIAIAVMLTPIALIAQTAEQARAVVSAYDTQAIGTFANEVKVRQTALFQEAVDEGYRLSFEGKGDVNTNSYFSQLQFLEQGKPVYFTTYNSKASELCRVSAMRNHPVFKDLKGENLFIGVWDGGPARATHREFGGRLQLAGDSVGYNGIGSDHATHVAGTLISEGIEPRARGMAPLARVKAFDWNFDLAEAASEVRRGMLISNHSYGFRVRDENGDPALSPRVFGGYIRNSRGWDILMYDAPYYLMVVAAGNDGEDDEANIEPLKKGFDKLTGHCVSKNGLVVGNAKDMSCAPDGELIALPEIVRSSSEGPTDDLRIKPDIVGNGEELYSTLHLGAAGRENNRYGQDGWTGTSMACPNVAGTLLLLQEYYEVKNDRFMRAASLKGLALHTADEAGPVGPDAVFGWGVIDGLEAAKAIDGDRNSSLIFETSLSQGQKNKLKFSAAGNVTVSISWTDFPGEVAPPNKVNDASPVLVNDLDLRLTKNGKIFEPWKLLAADKNGRGDNIVDPFERVDIIADAEASYEILVSHKGELKRESQDYSIIVTGEGLVFGGADVGGRGVSFDGKRLEKQLEDITARLVKIENDILRLNLRAMVQGDGSPEKIMPLYRIVDDEDIVQAGPSQWSPPIPSWRLPEDNLDAWRREIEEKFKLQEGEFSVRPGIGTPSAKF